MNNDIYFIQKTFALARKAEGNTSPNPLVGAVIVKDGTVISKGYHRQAGLPHAEIEALARVSEDLSQATLYINLEPCCHFGRTPPCVDEIIRRKIKRVVIATRDPNQLVKGKSIYKLKQAGISVSEGVCEKEAQRINEIFFLNMKEKRPFVAVKVAQSLDGKIATAAGISKWITSQAARNYGRALRDKYDAVVVGVNTIINDDPQLNGVKKKPYKVVIDPQLRIPLQSFIIKDTPERLVIVTSLRGKTNSRIKRFPSSIKFVDIEMGIEQTFSIKEVLRQLYKLGIMSIFVEGGATTIGSFCDSHIVDKVYFFVALKIVGGKEALSSVGGIGFISPEKCFLVQDATLKHLDDTLLITGYPKIRAVNNERI